MRLKIISIGLVLSTGFTLIPLAQAAAPFVHDVAARNIAGPGIELTWLTDVPADSSAYFETLNTSSFGQKATARCDAGGSTLSHCMRATGLAGNTIYYFEVMSCAAGTCGVQFISAKTGDGPPLINPPQAPSRLAVTLSGTSIGLTWTDNSSNESGFVIYKEENGAWNDIARVSANAIHYSEQNLPPGTHKYRVSSLIANPGMIPTYSAPSNQVSVTIAGITNPTTPPQTPSSAGTGACLIRNHYTQVPQLNAPDTSTGYGKITKPGVNDIASLRGACTDADYAALLKNYCASNYSSFIEQVATYDNSGNVARVECRTDACADISCPIAQSATPDTTPPSAPVLTASALSATEIRLTWSGALDDTGVVGYNIYRDDIVLKNNVTALSYDDGPFTPGTIHTYSIRSYDAAGNRSPESNRASVTTPLSAEHTAGSSTQIDAQTSIVTALPKISGVRMTDATNADVKIEWTTELPSGSHIIWGTQPNSYPKSSEWRCDGDGFVTAHCVNMTGLTPQTTYYYRAISGSPDGYIEYSPELTLTTPVATTLPVGMIKTSPQTTSFVADTTPPRIASFSVSPLSNGARVAFTAKFSKSIRPETLTAQNIFVYPADYPDIRVPGTLSLRPNGFDFVTQNLPDADHILIIKNAVKDLAGNMLAEDYISVPVRQHSAEQPSYPYPPVREKTPLYVTGWVLNVDDVSKISIMGARFNTTIDPSSVNIKTISIKTAGSLSGAQSAIPGSSAASNKSASFSSSAPLPSGRDYVGVVSAQIKSADGIALGVDFTCQFQSIAEGYYTSCPVGQATPPAPLPEVHAPASSDAVLSGTATDASGKALADISVNVSGKTTATTVTNSEGSFSLKLPPGDYTAQAFAPADKANVFTKPDKVELALKKNDSKNITFVFGIADVASKYLSGKVSLETGDAITDAQISAYNAVRGEWVTTFTKNDGTYEMKMGGGDWSVGISPRNTPAVWHFKGTHQAIRFADNSDIEKTTANFLVSSDNAKVFIHVTDGSQRPLKAGVTLDSVSASGATSPNTIRLTRFGASDENGNVMFNVPPGTYYVRGTLPSEDGFINPFEREIHPRANTESNLLLIFRNRNETATALLLGSVKFDDGRIAPNAFVWGWSERGESLTTRTNERGEFSFAGREGTKWHIGASLDVNGFKYMSGETIVDSGQNAKFTSLTLVKEEHKPLPPPVLAETPANATAVVESQNGVKVVLPPTSANASDTVSVSITPTLDTAKGAGVRIVGTAYDITLKDTEGRNITQLKDGIEISLPYTDLDLQRAGVTIENLTPSYFDANGVWVKIEGYVVDTVHHVIIVRVNHLTRFALIAPQDFTAPDSVSQIGVRLAGGGVVLTWKNPETDIHHVKIYRSELKGELGLLLDNFVLAETSLYVDQDVKTGTTYHYAVIGVDAAGNESSIVSSEAVTIGKPSATSTTTTPAPEPLGQLYRGMRGTRVWALQQSLEDLGFFPKEVGPTGYFGPITQFSVKTFQASRGLPPTGIVEASTMLELDKVKNSSQ